MKKLFVGLLALAVLFVLVFFFAGCGGNHYEDDSKLGHARKALDALGLELAALDESDGCFAELLYRAEYYRNILRNASGITQGSFWLSHAPGIFEDDFELRIFHDNPTAVIYYTIDGTEPVPGYPRQIRGARSAPIVVSGSVPQFVGTKQVQDRTADLVNGSILSHHTMALGWTSGNPNTFGRPPVGAEVRQGSSFRFRAFVDGEPISETITTTYVVWRGFARTFTNVPVVAMTAGYEDFLTVYNDVPQAYPRVRGEFYFEFFENDGRGGIYERKFHMVGSTQIGGNGSRGNVQRTFNVHLARGELEGHVTHPVFAGLYDLTRFRLWNGGNREGCGMRDPFVQKAAVMAGLNVIHGDYRLAVKIINGEFWGFTTIREHTSNNHFTYSRLGITPQNRASILDTNLDGSVDIQESAGGRTEVAYNELRTFVMGNDLTVRANKERLFRDFFCKDNFIDYVLVQTFFMNMDFAPNNVRLFRSAAPDPRSSNQYMDGLWRFILHDLDFAIPNTPTFLSRERAVDFNVFTRLYNPTSHRNATFRRLFTVVGNREFAEALRVRAIDVLGDGFSSNRLIPLFEDMRDARRPLMNQHFLRFTTANRSTSASLTRWNNQMASTNTFIRTRQSHYLAHLNHLVNRAAVD